MKPSRILFIDAGAGASGDMILGALFDLGVPLRVIQAAVARLPVRGFRLSERRVRRDGIAARQATVDVRTRQPERHWSEIQRILKAGRLEPEVLRRALAVFRRLVEAEAEVHGEPVAHVHLHEVGAVDAIVDIVGACVGLAHLAPDRIFVSRMTTGFGSVECAHGLYPVPAPATALLVRGVPVTAGGVEGERLTPTGAAILTTIADAWGPMPPMRPIAVGYGSGHKVFPGAANVLRMVLGEGEPRAASPSGEVIAIEATLDDCPAQTLAYAVERLREAGALDVFVGSVQMKKGRLGSALTVICRPADFDALAAVVFRETTTIGLRFRPEGRLELERRVDTVRSKYGPVRIKVGSFAGTDAQAWPEFEDCAALARRRGVPLKEVQAAALEAHRARSRPTTRAARAGKTRTARRTAGR